MVPTLRFVIVDDDEISRQLLEVKASQFPFLHKVASCANALETLEILRQTSVDILFADIEMPGFSGVDLVRNLAGRVPAPVFITSHPEYALESYEMEVFDYLVKPVSTERFEKCISRLKDFFTMRSKSHSLDAAQESGSIIIKQGYDKYKLLVSSIIFLEAMKDYTKIITEKSQYLVLETITSMLNRLPSGQFARIHRSYIVNRAYITAVTGSEIHLNTYELPIGKTYRKTIDLIM